MFVLLAVYGCKHARLRPFNIEKQTLESKASGYESVGINRAKARIDSIQRALFPRYLLPNLGS